MKTKKWYRIQNFIYQTIRGKDKISEMKDKDTVPVISTGTSAPTSTPEKIGNLFLDSVSKKCYISIWTSSSADWVVLN